MPKVRQKCSSPEAIFSIFLNCKSARIKAVVEPVVGRKGHGCSPNRKTATAHVLKVVVGRRCFDIWPQNAQRIGLSRRPTWKRCNGDLQHDKRLLRYGLGLTD